ncbi:5'-methylthioadenosine/S-adenosylhomocysteine nucleosidase [Candidatus Saccharibacteria bacterium]|nr:5'-methylthioadenosine/S-adenosylhomocysteine nucleosidase [Candidatus Saccharibacteria bacterium]
MEEFRNQKVLGIVVALSEEFNAVMATLDQPKKVEHLGRTFYCQDNICVTTSGVGQIDAASATEALLWLVRQHGGEVQQILNVGVVGALKKNLKVGQTLLVEKVVHYDFDLSADENYEVGQYLDGRIFFPTDTKLRDNLGGEIQLATLASGDKFLADPEKINQIVEQFNADICDMEGAAVVRVADRYNIPVVMVKTVSDSGDCAEFDENLLSAADNLKQILKEIIKESR